MAKFPLIQVNDRLYQLDYPFAYGLDDLMRVGAGGTTALARFVQKWNRLPRRPKFAMGKGGCTTFCVRDKESRPLMGRNFDYKDAPCLVVRTKPTQGYRSIGVTDLNMMLYGNRNHPSERNENRLYLAPFCCTDGINEKGLCIAILEIKAKATRQQRGRIPLTTTAILRAALDTCATVEEVIALFQRHDIRAALFCDYHYQVMDAEGNYVLLEYVGNELHILRNQPYAMNFYFVEGGDNRKQMGRTREKRVQEALRQSGGHMSCEEAMKLLNTCKLTYRHRLGHMVTCLWSAVYNCADADLSLCVGMDYSRVYHLTQWADT